MIACVDVHYKRASGTAGCVLFESWESERNVAEIIERVAPVEPYQPGQLYKRELPCILAVLEKVQVPLQAIVVDGYVWLGEGDKPGLGAKVYEALGETIPVIGVAKNPFRIATTVLDVYRGRSQRPLFVTAAGISVCEAAACITRMHGAYRIPTMLRRADQLCRQSKPPR
jgi:deoxyribonuclease V